MLLEDRLDDNAEDPFIQWFGKSRIVENGKPLVVYHGASEQYQFRPGNYFTICPTQASNYALAKAEEGGLAHVIPAYLKMENPAVLDDDHIEYAGYNKEEIHRLAQAGYDGMINEAMTEIVIFHSLQVCYAAGNHLPPTTPVAKNEYHDQMAWG